MVIPEDAQGVIVRTTPRHALSFQQLKLRCPCGIGNLKLPVCLFRFSLTFYQFAVLEKTQSVVIRSLRAAGAYILQWNQQQSGRNTQARRIPMNRRPGDSLAPRPPIPGRSEVLSIVHRAAGSKVCVAASAAIASTIPDSNTRMDTGSQ